MLPVSRLADAQNYGRAVATNLFAEMLNPEYRGPKFRWELLEEMAYRKAEAGFGMHIVCQDRDKSSLLASAKEAAGVQARMLLRVSKVQEWLPLTPTE